MDWTVLALLAGFSIGVGGLIGVVGVGGVLLVPLLTYGFGIEVHVAIAAAMFSYVFSGPIAATVYARQGSIKWNMAFWLVLGAAPMSFLGAMAISVIPPSGLELIIGGLVGFAGVNALSRSSHATDRADDLSAPALAVIGGLTGFGSALTGTGGPLVLVPMMVWLKVPVLTAVGLSQAVQFPIAALASVGNFLYGTIELALAAVMAAGLMLGAATGARLAHRFSPAVLRSIVAWVLVLVGAGMIGRSSIAFLGL